MKYLFIHGSWHTSYSWKAIVPFLEEKGHTVSCLNLPGTPSNPKPGSEVSYQDYYKCVKQELQKNGPSVLVAHSMAGIIAAPLQDELPDLVQHLFLVAAFVAQEGESLLSLAMTQKSTEISNHLHLDFISGTQTIDEEGARKVFYNDCSKDVIDDELKHLVPQPIAPMMASISWKDSGKVKEKRTYIVCENDKAVSPELQKQMASKLGCKIASMSSGHFPFLSQQKAFLDIITVIPE